MDILQNQIVRHPILTVFFFIIVSNCHTFKTNDNEIQVRE